MDLWYDQLSVGLTLTSAKRLVSKAEIIEFASRWDPQPFHLDDEAAKKSIFGQLVGCGTHTLAIVMRLGVECRVFTGNAVAGLGIDKVRYHSPLMPDSYVTVSFTVSDMRVSASKPGYGIVGWRAEMIDERNTHVYSAIYTNLYRRHPS